jgi:hypothetical protein
MTDISKYKSVALSHDDCKQVRQNPGCYSSGSICV